MATLLVAMESPERIQDRDALAVLLGSFERDGLLDLLVALADADPRLTEQVEHYVEHGHLPDAPDAYDLEYDDDLDDWGWHADWDE